MDTRQQNAVETPSTDTFDSKNNVNPPPRNQPRRWHRGKPARGSRSLRGRPFTPKSIANSNITVADVQPTLQADPTKVRPMHSFEPIFISTSYLATLVHLICQQVARTDPRLNMSFSELLYASSLTAFYQLARCDALLGLVYSDLYQIKMHLSGIVLPAPIVDYIQTIGPYRMLSGVNLIPSVATFMPADWRFGMFDADDQEYMTSFVTRNTIHPSVLLRQLQVGHELDASPLPLERFGETVTVWELSPRLLASYRMCTARLEKKIPTKAVSETLAGSPSIAVSTQVLSETSRALFCTEQVVLNDIRKSCLFNYHDYEQRRNWPRPNRRLLYPYFEAGYQDIASCVGSYLVME